jgi:serine/threonine protein kinase
MIEREVAIKTLLPDLPADIVPEVRERFLREARSAGRLNHPNIVTIHDVGEHDGIAYIAMELLQGRSLQQVLRGERLPFAVSAELCAQVGDALDHAQRFSIVHRDVKPANIMVDPAGRAKLTDFGVAHVPASSMTATGATLGSPKYMSPEQVLGLAPDPRSDIFSLGLVLYEMLSGQHPFTRAEDTAFSLMHRIASVPHAPLREVDPAIPAGLELIAERALAKKPEDRYQRAAEMASALRNYRALADSAYEKTIFAPFATAAGTSATQPPAAAPPAGEPAGGDRLREVLALDRRMRAAERHLSELAGELQAEVHLEPTRIEGQDVCHSVKVVCRSEAGLAGGEAQIIADYENPGAGFQLKGVRRSGLYYGEVDVDALEEAVQQLGRYLLGEGSEFEKYVRRS